MATTFDQLLHVPGTTPSRAWGVNQRPGVYKTQRTPEQLDHQSVHRNRHVASHLSAHQRQSHNQRECRPTRTQRPASLDGRCRTTGRKRSDQWWRQASFLFPWRRRWWWYASPHQNSTDKSNHIPKYWSWQNASRNLARGLPMGTSGYSPYSKDCLPYNWWNIRPIKTNSIRSPTSSNLSKAVIPRQFSNQYRNKNQFQFFCGPLD